MVGVALRFGTLLGPEGAGYNPHYPLAPVRTPVRRRRLVVRSCERRTARLPRQLGMRRSLARIARTLRTA